MKQRFYKIAIDGYSSCGKSTLAKDIAKAINFLHIDSGAMYRAVSLYILDHDIDVNAHDEIGAFIDDLSIDFVEQSGQRLTRLNGRVVEDEIRQQRVSNIVSQTAIIGSVRNRLVALQRELSNLHHVIMDGRDIGTVVFPDADLKLFLTADVDIRVNRRWLELKAKNIAVSKEDVKQNLQLRDHIDSTRKISPLTKATDAVEIDNTDLDRFSQLEKALRLIEERIGISRG